MSDEIQARFSRWIRDYGPHLLMIARSFASGHQDAEDLVQEVWLVALHQLQGGVVVHTSERAWLIAITLNVCRSAFRKRERRRRLRKARPPDHIERTNGITPAPISRHFIRGALWRCVAELPRLQREVFILRVLEDRTTFEVAQALGRSEGTVKASFHRAKKRLRAKLRGMGEETLRSIIGG